jgi:C4-dicarboxylate transporter DctQ subunit
MPPPLSSSSRYEHLGRVFAKLEDLLLVALLMSMVVLLNLAIFRRYVLNNTSPYSEEVARFLLIALVFLGIPAGIRHRGHITIDLLPANLSRRTAAAVDIVADALFLLFSITLAWLGLQVVFQMSQHAIVTDALGWPKWIIVAVIPLGSVLATVRLAGCLFSHWKRWRSLGLPRDLSENDSSLPRRD